MAEARIPEFFGDTQIREEVLDFMGLGTCMPREAWRLPSPQMLQFRMLVSIRFLPHGASASKRNVQVAVRLGPHPVV